MDEPVILRIVRPYATESEFLEAEGWTLEAKGALLLNQRALEPGTLVRFDVLLSSGERLIRAEGKVVKVVPDSETRPGGLRVRFTRFGGSTKTLIDRVVAARRQSNVPPGASLVPPQPARVEAPRPPPPVQEPPPAPARQTEPSAELRSSVRAVAPRAAPASAPPLAASAEVGTLHRALRDRSVRSVVAPENRDALLERLRERSRRSRG